MELKARDARLFLLPGHCLAAAKEVREGRE